MERNKKTDQNLVCEDNLKVTTKIIVVNLNKPNYYIVRLTSHISLEYPPPLIDADVPMIYMENKVISTASIMPYAVHMIKLE